MRGSVMRFFDYIFYRVSAYYIKRWGDTLGYFNGIALVVVMLITHMFFVIIVVALTWEPANRYIFVEPRGRRMTDPLELLPVLAVITLVSVRYLKFKKFQELEMRWQLEDSRLRRRRGWLIAIYIVLNVATTSLLSVYRKYYL
jgi:hypothetical protein